MQRATDHRSGFDRFYSVVVLVKGLDGVVELVLGAVLLVSPATVRGLVLALAAELGEGTSTLSTLLAAGVARAGGSIGGAVLPAALFFLVHGAVKLLTVYALLRRLLRWYPWAIAALLVLLLVQAMDTVSRPALGTWLLCVLDVLVLTLVVVEYHRLRRGAAERHRPLTPHREG